ncbi:MAG: transcription termination/antitermination NusG family protein, partial [Aeromicrobium sp.]
MDTDESSDIPAADFDAPADVEETTDEVDTDGAEDAADEAESDEAESDEPPVVDVLQEFKDRLRSQIGDWYVVHTYSGMEKRVKSNLENRVTSLNAEDFIFEVVVPTE